MYQRLIRLVRLHHTPEQDVILDALRRLGMEPIPQDHFVDDQLPCLVVRDHQARMPDPGEGHDRHRLLISFAGDIPAPPGTTLIRNPDDPAALANLIRRWLKNSGYRGESQPLLPGVSLIGRSESFLHLLELIHQVAQYQAPVLLKGETGTGKEVVARAIHYQGSRQDCPFVPINCGGYNDDLFVAELFGHERGAFTDAKQRRSGLVEQARGGTLFLDEIDSLSQKSQAALLRFMQDREYRPLGSSEIRRADVRLIAASNRPLESWAREGRFREDLLFRLDILGLELPNLRDRADDIPLLAEHFLDQFSRQYNKVEKYLHSDTLAWMMEYHWPGNIRELENYMHRLYLLCPTEEILVRNVKGDPPRDRVATRKKSRPAPGIATLKSFSEEKSQVIEEFERRYLEQVLRATGGNIAQAARIAGKERRTFGRLVKKYGFFKSAFA